MEDRLAWHYRIARRRAACADALAELGVRRMRTAFVRDVDELAEQDERIWLLCGDLGFSVLEAFANSFPKQLCERRRRRTEHDRSRRRTGDVGKDRLHLLHR